MVVNTAEGLVVANTTEVVVCVAVVGGGLGFGLAPALPLVIDASCRHVGSSANAYGTTVV